MEADNTNSKANIKPNQHQQQQDSAAKSKATEIFVIFKSFYNKHFPTDQKTYHYRVVFTSLILSILGAHCMVLSFNINFNRGVFLVLCYLLVSAGTSYELLYGLQIGDRKQFTPWILFKIVEIGLQIAGIAVGFNNHIALDVSIGAILISVLDFILLFVITRRSVWQIVGRRDNKSQAEDDNIYDNYDDV